jgi:hypothetical protein
MGISDFSVVENLRELNSRPELCNTRAENVLRAENDIVELAWKLCSARLSLARKFASEIAKLRV